MKKNPKQQLTGYSMLVGARPTWMPRGMWMCLSGTRAVGRAASAVLLVLLLLHILAGLGQLGVIRLPRGLAEYSQHLLMPTALLLFLVLAVVPRVGTKKFFARLRAHEYEICTNCGYSLHGLPEDHDCPECGTAYRVEQIRETWHDIGGS